MTQLLTSSADHLLADLVEELTHKLAAGDSAAVEAFLADHADQAEQLRPLIPALQVLAEMASSPRAVGRSLTSLPEPNGHESNGHPVLGDFRILREVGRGGMGVVYEAEQISLRRRVALKVLPSAAMLDPRALQRFRNEAQAAAALHHSQIVPIYGVGCERGVHYYAMQFIDGLTLAEVITSLRQSTGLAPLYQPDAAARDTLGIAEAPPAPSPQPPAPSPSATETEVLAGLSTEKSRTSPAWFRRIAEQFAQVAEALDHAHELGVTHRDIKPANLMLDRLGHIWITDFGLARIEGEGNLTMTGDLVGTLRYMSPEQALAKRIGIDHRTDIYSLGITLYELLTLHPALPSQGRQELLRQIAFDEPQPPRKQQRAIPIDLETIVLKMIEKNPAERYQTAAELVADLKRFAEDRHIEARRPSLYSRTLKWSRRHVEWVVSASLIAVILLAATTLVTFITAAHDRERAINRLRINKEIGDELRQATALGQSANAAKGNDRLLWSQARDHAQRAAALATSEIVDPSLQKEVSQVVKDLDERQRDWALLAAVDTAWFEYMATGGHGGAKHEFVVPLFVKALADFGIDMGQDTPEAAARRIATRPRDVQLAVFTILDELLYHPDVSRDTWINKVLLLADDNAWRAARRRANAIPTPAEKLASLRQLARSQEAKDQPAILICHVGMDLYHLGDSAAAIAVMRSAADSNPGNVQINHYLGFVFFESKPPQFSEAIRYGMAAVALQPKNPLLLANLGTYLGRAGQHSDGEYYLREALRLRPDYGRAHAMLGNVLAVQDKHVEAEEEFRKAVHYKPQEESHHTSLARVVKLVKDDAQYSRIAQEGTGAVAASDLAQLATFALVTKHVPAVAVDLYSQAFSQEPTVAEDLDAAHRYNAACAALLTAMEKGEEPEKLDESERVRLKRQALAWLADDLAAWDERAKGASPVNLPHIVEVLKHWQADTDLVTLRDASQIQQLTAHDQQRCLKLWSDHAQLLKLLQTRLVAEAK